MKMLFHVSIDPKFEVYESIRALTVQLAMLAFCKKYFMQFREQEANVTVFARHVDDRSFAPQVSQHFSVAKGTCEIRVVGKCDHIEFLTIDDAEAMPPVPPPPMTMKRKLK